MPKKITKAGNDFFDENDDLEIFDNNEYNSEIISNEFNFPKNLSKMTEAEKEKLAHSYLLHRGPVAGSLELNPSKVMEPGSPEYEAKKKLKNKNKSYEKSANENSPFEFDSKKGLIVKGEDPYIINGLDMSDEDREDRANLLKKSVKYLTKEEVDAIKYKQRFDKLDPIDREIEERFWDI